MILLELQYTTELFLTIEERENQGIGKGLGNMFKEKKFILIIKLLKVFYFLESIPSDKPKILYNLYSLVFQNKYYE